MTIKDTHAVITSYLKPDTNTKLGNLAKMMQTSKSTIIRWAIEEYLAKKLSA